MQHDGLQSAGEGDRYMGNRLLWLKVIARAIFDYVLYKDCPILEKRKYYESASVWLFEPSKLFNGFENLCAFLGYPPELFRERARKMTKDDIRKIEHMERVAEVSGEPFGVAVLKAVDPKLLESSWVKDQPEEAAEDEDD